MPTPRRELLMAGATVAQLDVDLRAGRTVSVFRGVHAAAGQERAFLSRIRAAAATQDVRALATFITAAVLHRFRWLPAAWVDPRTTLHFAVPQDEARRHREGLRLHRRLIGQEDAVLIDGVACFSVPRTLVELARSRLPALLVVQILDGALRDGRVTKEQLESCLARFPGERGIARARSLVRRARYGVDSPRETELRLMFEDGGLPELDVPLEVRDAADGMVLARGDLGYRQWLIWGEYDGFESHTQRKSFRSDRVGDRALRGRGWHVMRFVDEDFARPGIVCRQVAQAIADAPARIAAVPASRSPEVAAARKMLGLG